MSKKSVLFLLFILLAAVSLEAKSLLYKVSGPKNTVYILGSIHLAKPELYPLDSAIEQAYRKSDVLVVELDAESPDSAAKMQQAMATLGRYKKGRTLRSELGRDTYRQLQAYAKTAGLSLEQLEQLRPWVVVLQLSVLEMVRLGYSPDLGIDKHFVDMAKRSNKPIVALETVEEQMALLSREEKAYQEKLLRYTLTSMQQMEPMLSTLFISWRKGDAKTIAKLFVLNMQEDPELKEIYNALIKNRNDRMTEKIMAYLKTDSDYFVVVGAGHVVGDDGIVNLLKKNGLQVIQK